MKVSSSTNKGLHGNSPTDIPPWIITLYGPSGIGKTSFGAEFEDVGFLIGAKERGVQVLQKYGRIPNIKALWEAEDWEDAINILENIPAEIKTLVVDSLTVLETMCFHHHCDAEYDGDWSKEGFMGFQSGPRNAARYEWPRFTEAIERICNDQNTNVLMITHSKQKMYSNPVGPDYEVYCPVLEGPTWEAVHPFCHGVFFYKPYVEVNAAKGTRKGKASQDEVGRNIYTEASPAYFAKNWFGLEPIIDAGETSKEAHDNFMSAMHRALKSKKRLES